MPEYSDSPLDGCLFTFDAIQAKKLDEAPGFVENYGGSPNSVGRMLEDGTKKGSQEVQEPRKPLFLLVAGGGFEPPTFGL